MLKILFCMARSGDPTVALHSTAVIAKLLGYGFANGMCRSLKAQLRAAGPYLGPGRTEFNPSRDIVTTTQCHHFRYF